MTEAEELLSDLKAVYGELLPADRNPDALRISDGAIALGALLRREIELATIRLERRIERLEKRIERMENAVLYRGDE